jgi:hypothetical protein
MPTSLAEEGCGRLFKIIPIEQPLMLVLKPCGTLVIDNLGSTSR